MTASLGEKTWSQLQATSALSASPGLRRLRGAGSRRPSPAAGGGHRIPARRLGEPHRAQQRPVPAPLAPGVQSSSVERGRETTCGFAGLFVEAGLEKAMVG